MAYIQNFTALDGTVYTIEVQGVTLPNGATTPPLTENPFETNEEADTDMFMPTRTQSGYIHIKSIDMNTWQSFIPNSATAEPVFLKQGNTILWQGYVQTGTYGMTFPAKYEDFNLPLICPLGALDSFDIDPSGPGDSVTIGQLLNYIFSKLTGLTFTFYFHTGSSSTVNAWLEYKTIWRNFLNASNGNLTSRFTCLDVLQELCKFFGWTCRTQGANVYFTSITDDGRNTLWRTYTLAGLATATPESGFPAMTTRALVDADFASTNHNEEYIPGIKSVEFNSELNNYDVLMEIPVEEIFLNYKYDNATRSTRLRNNTKKTQDIFLLHRESVSYENELVSITSYTEKDGEHHDKCYGRFIAFDSDMNEEKQNYSWTKCFECFMGDTYEDRVNTTPLFSMESKAAFTLGNGVLYITGRLDRESLSPLAMAGSYAQCQLRVGDKYWNGETWTSTASYFVLDLDLSSIKDTDTVFNLADYSGTGIAVNGLMSGRIYFAVISLPRNYRWFNGYFPLMDFKIGFVRDAEDDSLNDKNYVSTGGNFPDKKNVDTIFSTDKTNTINNITRHCQAGYGLLFSSNSVVDTIYFGHGLSVQAEKPEQHMADMIAAYGRTIRRVLTLDLWISQIGTSVGPNTRVTLGGQTFYPVAVSRSWRDNVTTLTLMEI